MSELPSVRIWGRTSLAVFVIMTATVGTDRVVGQEFVLNGDFQQDLDLWIAWPGYINGTEETPDGEVLGPNPGEISEWFGTGGIGINPVQSSGPSNPRQVVGFQGIVGGYGINPVAFHEDPNPFKNNGDNDTSALFLQNSAAIRQSLSGLEVGQNYTLSLDYNARDCCGDFPVPELRLNGMLMPDFPDPQSSPDGVVIPVGDVNPWYTSELVFTADSPDLTVEIWTSSEVAGDSTFLVDNLELIPFGGGDNLIVNGDFETDADAFDVWPGYVSDGRSPFRDNGGNLTAVAFMQGSATLEQDISNLTVGEEYIFSFDYNARGCCDGNVPGAEVTLNDILLDVPDLESGVDPVGGANDWYHYETTVVADSTTITARFNTFSATGGDATFILDNVSFRVATESIPGDFNNDGVLDSADIDELTRQSASAANDVTFDLNDDQLVNTADVSVWIEDFFASWIGDTNLDKQFNSNDLVQMLAAGTYETNGPAVWSEGDFDGNGLANSSDLVSALAGGGYEQGERPATAAVPEPTAATLIGLAICLLGVIRRRK